MLDSAQVLYVAPEKCVSRQDEINGDKSEQKLSFSVDGSIKVTKQAMQLRCETSGELKLRQCYLRRALAFDQVGLAGFTVQEAYPNQEAKFGPRTSSNLHGKVRLPQVCHAQAAC